ncbi:Regulatory protein RecX [Lentibacillus sp. JNUCC-1]|uniref:recombination regulator RecX n=1 Tax=Lentibacillus sp. JNUCC-1 TaxID=2654513 RepID=UPI0012E7A871|nr:recombination regulator RecX [Lentibacillus sp. JNUCC-1]MUV38707.1 Regulatory protein RecX [Lentibacillus sp. JNUCC-1]
MATITRITTQKKQKQRYNIYLDRGAGETFGFGVDEAVLIKHRLHKGMELDDAFMNTLIDEDTQYKAYSLAINYLSYRMRTKKEIYDYLIKKEIHPEHVESVMQRLIDEQLVDDRQFAKMFTESRIRTSAKGPGLVKKELLEKGVPALYADEAASLYTYAIQYDKAAHWMQKRLNRSNRDSFRQQLQKLHGFLLQKGFDQGVIQDVLDTAAEHQDDGQEWEALQSQGHKLIRKHQSKRQGFELQSKVKEGLYRKGFPMELINAFIEETFQSET